MTLSPAAKGIDGDMYINNSEMAFECGFATSKRESKNAPMGTDVATLSSTFPENDKNLNVITFWSRGTPATGTPNP
jgi:hypothetical protein